VSYREQLEARERAQYELRRALHRGEGVERAFMRMYELAVAREMRLPVEYFRTKLTEGG